MCIYKLPIEYQIKWAYGTAIFQFIFFLLMFLGVSYLSTLIDVDNISKNNGDSFVYKYGKYFVLASSLYMIVPFALSTVLLYGLLIENPQILLIYINTSIGSSAIIILSMFGSGVFIVIKGTSYIGYTLIGVSIFLTLLMVHSIVLIYFLVPNMVKDNEDDQSFVETDVENGDIDNTQHIQHITDTVTDI